MKNRLEKFLRTYFIPLGASALAFLWWQQYECQQVWWWLALVGGILLIHYYFYFRTEKEKI